MSDRKRKPISLVDSTHRIRWEITKEEFDNCAFPDSIFSPTYAIDINDEESEWYLSLRPKGPDEEDKDKVAISLHQESENKVFRVRYDFAIETETGHWPNDSVKEFYSRGSYEEGNLFGHTEDESEDNPIWPTWEISLCTTEEFEKYFVDNKIAVVASFIIYEDGNKYRKHMEVADCFVDEIRSMSSQNNLSDFTIISGKKRFPCHRVLLAVRSKYFEALFRNEPTKKVVKIEESPKLVKTMLEYISNGIIPSDIDDNAMDLILMSDLYGLDLLTVACATSLVTNLTPDNALETLIVIDKVKHVSKQEHFKNVVAYIKREADQVVKTKDWKTFIQNYPDLITEIVLLKP